MMTMSLTTSSDDGFHPMTGDPQGCATHRLTGALQQGHLSTEFSADVTGDSDLKSHYIVILDDLLNSRGTRPRQPNRYYKIKNQTCTTWENSDSNTS